MTCTECLDLMLEVARLHAAPLVERDVLAHTASCPGCRQRLERERSLSAGLQALARDTLVGEQPELEARLLDAFALHHGPARSRVAAATRASWLALAATVALGAGAALWWTVQQSSAPAAVVATSRPEPVAPPVAGPIEARPSLVANSEARADAVALQASPPRSRPQPVRPARRGADRAVQAVGFVQIPSAVGLPDFESGEIVRLGIPVTALPNYGVEIPAGVQSSIQADFLIGQDGQARAIRLVSASTDASRPPH